MKRYVTSLGLVLALGAAAAWAWRPRRPVLPGAVYASQLPLYPGARYDIVFGGTLLDDTGAAIAESRTWFLDVDDPAVRVAAWYRRELGVEPRPDDLGNVVFEVAPRGGADGERLTVTIEPERLQIREDTRTGRHRQ